MTLELPALRSRPGDIPALAEHFLRKYAEANGVKTPRLSEAALDMLRAHRWRGNVRELENTMHRAVLLCQDDTLERSEEHTSELQSLMRISYAVFCLQKKKTNNNKNRDTT